MYCHLRRNYIIGRTNGKQVLFTSKIIKSFISGIYQPKYLPIGSAVVVVVVVGAGEKDKTVVINLLNTLKSTVNISNKYCKKCTWISKINKNHLPI